MRAAFSASWDQNHLKLIWFPTIYRKVTVHILQYWLLVGLRTSFQTHYSTGKFRTAVSDRWRVNCWEKTRGDHVRSASGNIHPQKFPLIPSKTAELPQRSVGFPRHRETAFCWSTGSTVDSQVCSYKKWAWTRWNLLKWSSDLTYFTCMVSRTILRNMRYKNLSTHFSTSSILFV